MFFNVYIDPEVVDEAQASGAMGVGRLCEHLYRMRWDCIVADTYTRDVTSDLARRCKSLEGMQNDRKKLGELIIHLWKKKPVIHILPVDAGKPLREVAIDEIEQQAFDILISPHFEILSKCGLAELSNFSNLHQTLFNQNREQVGPGVSFDFAEASFEDLCNRSFKKLVRYAEKLALVDYSLGEHQDGTQNQENGVKRWINWLNGNLENARSATLTIHTVKKPTTTGLTALENQINALSSSVDLKILLVTVSSKHDLPHQRYLMVDKHWIKIDRGFDLADHQNNCRECSFSYSKRPPSAFRL